MGNLFFFSKGLEYPHNLATFVKIHFNFENLK